MENRERMSHLIDMEEVPSAHFLLKLFKPVYNVHKFDKIFAIETDKVSQFKMFCEGAGTKKPFVTISLLCALWIPVQTRTNSTITVYLKDDCYVTENQRTLLSTFPTGKTTNFVYKMHDYKATADIGQLKLHVLVDNLDLQNTCLGTLRLLMLVKGAEESLPRAKLPPSTIIFDPPETEDVSYKVHKEMIDELKNCYKDDSDSFLKMIASTLKKIDKDAYIDGCQDFMTMPKPKNVKLTEKNDSKTLNPNIVIEDVQYEDEVDTSNMTAGEAIEYRTRQIIKLSRGKL